MKFYLKKSVGESNLIMGKLYDAQFHDGRFVYSTGERINPSQWGNGKPKKGHESLQIRLNQISSQAADYIRLNRSSLTKEGLKKHLDGLRPQELKPEPKAKKNTLVSLWTDYLETIKNTVEPRTFNSYSNSFTTSKEERKGKNFYEFLKSKGWQDIEPDKFTLTHYNLYHGYLKTNVKPNTAAKRLKHLKQFLSYLVDGMGIKIGFDHTKITFKETAGLKISLSEDELQTYIDATDLPAHLVRVRDLAVLQCSTGLRISDRKRIDKNITGNKIKIEAQKTRSAIEIPITPQVREILERYNYELPQISEQNYRQGIKDIHKKLFPEQSVQVREGNTYKDVFVWEEISSHDMVRTFITLSAERGMPINAIAKITGKSVATLLKNYLVESQKVADKEMEKAWGSSPLKVSR
ncbi:MAG TPA: hypothetical protein VGD40_10085 [Chryseosolibacter sp.]